MFSVRHERLLELSPAQAWQRLRDLTLAPHYVPGLTGSVRHPGPLEGPGASRRVFLKSGAFLDESVIQWRDGQGFALRLHRAEQGPPFPFRKAYFHYALEPGGDGRTCLRLSLEGELRGGWLTTLLLGGLLRRNVERIGANLKAFYESGQTQNADFQRRARSVP
ncbi:SRPBCC family protein [Pseudomonas panipatensis]|uniref:Polyketide cyclase / dehydrase and lipid transport n=1 Tax=Pseudomonas panipatensis TaxID=428992 RepID=A0A1G8ELF3_9PSED|nr:SRPBCC family protein [Pseudomonas panipatensis]SDH70632.1 Polyketide cyclase / dehydrase and lipid transport [Pseudomonas panipatensis]SMP68317.1 Polyketide cyclase / dehydrase and lipid transport [Pseudomonas panipatensis]